MSAPPGTTVAFAPAQDQVKVAHPYPTMQPPTPEQLHGAIEVLNALGERLNTEVTHSVTQLPETRLGNHYAARLGARAMDQATSIHTVAARLEYWREELFEQRRRNVRQHVYTRGLMPPLVTSAC
jgi:hypothetical protein